MRYNRQTQAVTDKGQPAGRSRRGLVICAALAMAMTSLTGCVTSFSEYIHNGFKVGPNYCKPAAPVAEHWIDYQDDRVHSQPPQHWAWWRVFNDSRLDRLIETAFAQNITLREAGFRVMEARARRAITVGNLFPQQQQLFGSYDRQQLSLETAQIKNAAAFGAVNRNFDLWTFGGQLAWELDFWGRFRRAVESADAELDASVENYDDVLVILISDVAAAYIDVRTAEQRLRYARENVRNQSGSLDIATDKVEGGASSRLDVTQAQTNLAQTEALVPQLQTQLRQAQNRLCVLMGIPPQDISRLLDGPSEIPNVPAEVSIGIPAELIRRRPDVRRAEREVAAQSARIGIAEADLYPAFTINGSIFVQAQQFADLFRSSAVGGNVGPSFNWNILNYGRIRNSIVVEEALYFQEVAQYQNAVLNANREAEDALVAFLRAQDQTRALRQGAVAAAESRDLVNELYRGGRADFGRVFVAEFFLAQQQDALAQAQGLISLALIDLYRALGGGWQLRLERTPPVPAIMPSEAEPSVEPLPPTAPAENDLQMPEPPAEQP
jgi:NodT family efflux transporter outer membrane factor (OMF) lipoprotein